MKIPIVCLVGRTNVGKSALFNRIANQKVKSLVFDKEHVTRDYIESLVTRKNTNFQLVDTGGIFAQARGDALDALGKEKALEVVKRAHLVFFVCDAKVGVLDDDVRVLKLLRKLSKDIVLVVNKVDNCQLELEASVFQCLGITDIFYTSAVHGRGVDELVEFVDLRFAYKQDKSTLCKITKNNEEDSEIVISENDSSEEDLLFSVSIIGKPNVGKSSLLNLLSSRDRSIVSPIEGTTREAVGTNVKFNHQLIGLWDTPGVRRQASVNDPLEQKMVKAALASIRVSDIVILVIDASKGELCNQELKLLDYALVCKKAVLLIINKVDLLDEALKVSLEYDLERYEFMLKKVQVIKTSCVDKKGIGKIFNALDALWKRCRATFDTDQVTDIIRKYLIHKPLYKQNKILKVFKVRFVNAKVPTFQLYVNEPKMFSDAELSCFENVLRKNLNLRGCPVVLHPVKI